MKIRIILSDERDVRAVERRFYAVAEAYGIPPDEARREAMLFWLHMLPPSSDFTLELTDAEWKELRPMVAAIREKNAGGGPQSSHEEPAS